MCEPFWPRGAPQVCRVSAYLLHGFERVNLQSRGADLPEEAGGVHHESPLCRSPAAGQGIMAPSPTSLKSPSIPPIFSYCRLFYQSMPSRPKRSRDHRHSHHTWIPHTVRRTYETAHPSMGQDRCYDSVSADRWRHADATVGRESGVIRRPAAHLDG